MLQLRASVENFPGRGATEKRPNIIKKYRKIALFASSRGGPTEKKDRKIAKKAENSTFKPLFTIFVPYLKIQGGPRPPAPRCRRPWLQ